MAALRSTKDLRNIVSHARMSNFPPETPKNPTINTTAISEEKEEQGEISSDGDTTYEMRFKKRGKAQFGKVTTPKVNEFEAKFIKQLELSQNDADVIESQLKKICLQKSRIEELEAEIKIKN